jgi:uncharacterized protein
MAKAPVPGEAKTRLAAVIGPEAAAAVHTAFLQASVSTAMAVAREVDAYVALMCPDERHAKLLRELPLDGVAVWAQTRPGLMAGITEAFERAAALGSETVVVGETDSPNLPAAHLIGAFRLLTAEEPGIVLGPCADGGYYLVGGRLLAQAIARELFEGERYDSSTICRRTADRARELGLRVELGPEWYDVDTVDELRQLEAELAACSDGHLAELRHALARLNRGSVC